ncbi:MAG: FHA domain-containing protein [Gemmataceae bacterium]
MSRSSRLDEPTVDPLPGRGLFVEHGPGAGSFIPFRFPVTLIGRSGSCDVCVDVSPIRPLHCMLTPGRNGVSLRSVSPNGVRVNGKRVSIAELNDDDLLDIGPARLRIRWDGKATGDDSLYDSLRIQAAAVAAQQTALIELEIRVTDREAALTRQEDQLASRLEDQRRQLLSLQDQITQARANLRDKRAAFVTLAAEQEEELAAARQTVESDQKAIARREVRLARLWTKLKDRIGKQHRDVQRERDRLAAELQRRQKQVALERETLASQREQFHGQAELEKRQITDGWNKLQLAEATLRDRLAGFELRERRLARREKELLAEENRRARQDRETVARREDLQREIRQLEARAASARTALEQTLGLDKQATPALPATPVIHDEHLERAADEIADEQALLTEQVDRFARVRMEWEEERLRALAEFDAAAAELANREGALTIREAEINAAEGRANSHEQVAHSLSRRAEAERMKAMAELAERRAELERIAQSLSGQSRELARREQSLTELYRFWGRRRTAAFAALNDAQASNAASREEWASLHANWLRAQARLLSEQQELAAQRLAVEQYRQECIDASADPQLGARRLERLRRHWHAKCSVAKRDMARLAAMLTTESERLDQRFAELQRDEVRLQSRVADLDDLFAAAEIQQANVASERVQRDEQIRAEAKQRESYERQLTNLRGQLDQLASLFIDTPTVSESKAA